MGSEVKLHKKKKLVKVAYKEQQRKVTYSKSKAK